MPRPAPTKDLEQCNQSCVTSHVAEDAFWVLLACSACNLTLRLHINALSAIVLDSSLVPCSFASGAARGTGHRPTWRFSSRFDFATHHQPLDAKYPSFFNHLRLIHSSRAIVCLKNPKPPEKTSLPRFRHHYGLFLDCLQCRFGGTALVSFPQEGFQSRTIATRTQRSSAAREPQ